MKNPYLLKMIMILFISLIVTLIPIHNCAKVFGISKTITIIKWNLEGKCSARQLQETSNFGFWMIFNFVRKKSCDIVEISDFSNNFPKKEVFLSSRVHPGETMTSFVIEKMIEILLGNSQEAKFLRRTCIFRVYW